MRAECGIGERDPAEVAWTKLSDRFASAVSATSDAPEQVISRLAPIGRLLGIITIELHVGAGRPVGEGGNVKGHME